MGMKLSLSKPHVTVNREGGEVVYEATIRWDGHYHAATHLDPPDYPEPVVDECWRTVGDGDPVKLHPSNLPDDVYDEIILLAENGAADEGPDDSEPDDDALERARWEVL